MILAQLADIPQKETEKEDTSECVCVLIWAHTSRWKETTEADRKQTDKMWVWDYTLDLC